MRDGRFPAREAGVVAGVVRWALCVVAVTAPASRVADAEGAAPAVFVGSTPCDVAIRPLLGMRGDDDVLFLLDAQGRPRTGNAEFSYTLNRRRTASVP
jgi:hypothetical protein